MRNYLITAVIVWACGFAVATNVANAVDQKLDSMQSARNAQLCQIDEVFCK